MHRICPVLAALAMAALTWSAAPPATTAKKTPVKNTAVKSGARKASAKSAKSGGKKSASKTTWRNRQLTPSQERNKEIQEALAAKGYLSSENATGSWDQASIDALKRFQAEQNIESTGKINSLSLIALGLGPKHAAPAQPTENTGSR